MRPQPAWERPGHRREHRAIGPGQPGRTDLAGNKYTGADPRTKLIADGLKNGHTPFALPFGDLFNNPNGPWVATIRAALYGPDLNKALADGQSKIQAGLDAAN